MPSDPAPRNTVAIALLFGTLLVVVAGLVAVNGSGRSDVDVTVPAAHVERDGGDTTVVAPGTKVETQGDKTRVQAPFVDVTVPRDRD